MALLLAFVLGALAGPPGPVLPKPMRPAEVQAFAEAALAAGAAPSDARLACEDLVEGLRLCYRVIDGALLRLVTEADLAAWGETLPGLRASATAASRGASPLKRRPIEGGGEYFEVEAVQGHEALVLLHPEWLAPLGSRPRVAFPARDLALAWGALDPEVDHIMAVAVRDAHDRAPHPVSPLVLTWDGQAWQAWGEARPKAPDLK